MGMLPLVRQIARGEKTGHVKRSDAVLAAGKLRQAGRWRDSVGARESTKVVIEGSILLHDPDDVIDLLEAGRERLGICGRVRWLLP
jgi:hypothetical protein